MHKKNTICVVQCQFNGYEIKIVAQSKIYTKINRCVRGLFTGWDKKN